MSNGKRNKIMRETLPIRCTWGTAGLNPWSNNEKQEHVAILSQLLMFCLCVKIAQHARCNFSLGRPPLLLCQNCAACELRRPPLRCRPPSHSSPESPGSFPTPSSSSSSFGFAFGSFFGSFFGFLGGGGFLPPPFLFFGCVSRTASANFTL